MDDQLTLVKAATILRERAEAATPGPWRDSSTADGVRFHALVSDVRHRDRMGAGWDWDEGYGGCLVGESLMSGDLSYIATLNPTVGLRLADGLEQHGDLHSIYDCQDKPCHLLSLAVMINGGAS